MERDVLLQSLDGSALCAATAHRKKQVQKKKGQKADVGRRGSSSVIAQLQQPACIKRFVPAREHGKRQQDKQQAMTAKPSSATIVPQLSGGRVRVQSQSRRPSPPRIKNVKPKEVRPIVPPCVFS
jgi:hypothetical protein